eukprot:4059494-Amphidinium_carterae.1
MGESDAPLNLHICSPDGPRLPSQSVAMFSQPRPMLLTWNINSLACEQDAGRLNTLCSLQASVLCLAETRKSRGEIQTLQGIIWSRSPIQAWTPVDPLLSQWFNHGLLTGGWVTLPGVGVPVLIITVYGHASIERTSKRPGGPIIE